MHDKLLMLDTRYFSFFSNQPFRHLSLVSFGFGTICRYDDDDADVAVAAAANTYLFRFKVFMFGFFFSFLRLEFYKSYRVVQVNT